MKKTLLLFGAGLLIPVLLLLISPVIAPALLLFFPVMFAFPAALVVLTRKPVIPLAYGLLSAIGLSIVFGWFGVAMGVISAFFGISVGASILKKQPVTQTFIRTSVGYGILFIAFISLCHTIFDINLITEIFTTANEIFDGSLAQLSADNTFNPEMLDTLRDTMHSALAQMKLQFPSLLCIYAVILGYITLWIISLVHYTAKITPFIPHFSRFRCTNTTIWVFLICIMGTLFCETDSALGIVFANIYSFIRFLLLFCALSIADHWMKNKKWHVVLRTLAVIALMLGASTYLISLFLNILALIDARVNFRKLED